MFTQEVEYEVLVSCVDEDRGWSEKLVKRLRKQGITTQLNGQRIPISQQLRSWINGQASNGQKLIAVGSQHYLYDQSSRQLIEDFCQQQVFRLAGERLLIPILLNRFQLPHGFTDLPPIDFSNHKDNDLRFRQLLEALDWQSKSTDDFISTPQRILSLFLEQKEVNHKEGFADQLAKLYGLLDFEVDHVQKFDDSTCELLLSKTEAGFHSTRAVECHESALSPTIASQVIGRYRQTPDVQRIVVTSKAVSSDLKETLLKEARINTVLYTDLLFELAPMKDYAKKVIDDFHRWRADNWDNNDWFIRPDVTTDKNKSRKLAMKHIANWLGDKGTKHLAILGDLGTGKTTLVRFLAYELAKAFLADPLRHPAPVFIELNEDMRKEVALNSIIIKHFDQMEVPLPSIKRFEHLVKTGRIILLFDAFDEMADRLHDEEVKKRNLEQLLKPSQYGGKVLITSRTHYFKDYSQQVKLLGDKAEFIYLSPFTEDQAQEYLARARPATKDEDWQLIKSIYSLTELIRRPLFLHMVVKSLSTSIQHNKLDSAKLYSVYVNSWIDREMKKGRRLGGETKIRLMEDIAWWMWSEERIGVHHEEVMAYAERVVSANRAHFGDEGIEVVTGEIGTASFLNRNKNNFSFVDKSFKEYFVARKIHKSLIHTDGRASLEEALKVRPLELEIIFFVTQIDENDQMRQILRDILTRDYTPQISENALRILYWSARIQNGMMDAIRDPAILRGLLAERLPPGARLSGAKLNNIELEAVDISGANLSGADLTGANLKSARLYDINLRRANLTQVNLDKAMITRCDLREAVLNKATVIDAKLLWCDFNGILHHEIVFKPESVENTKGLSGIDRLRPIDLRPVLQCAHSAGVNAVACSPDGKLCASGGSDGLIVIHRIEDGRVLQVIEAHRGRVTSLGFSPNGVSVVSGGEDSMVKVCSINEGSLVRTLKGHTRAVRSVSFSHNGDFIASGADDKEVRLWGTDGGQTERIYPGHTTAVNAVGFSVDDKLIASGSSDGSVRLWETGSGLLKKMITLPSDRYTQLKAGINCLDFSPDGKSLATGGDDTDVRLWSIDDGQILRRFEGHRDVVRTVRFSPNGKWLVSAGHDTTIRLWNLTNANKQRLFEGHKDIVKTVGFTPDGTSVISGADDRYVRIWNFHDGRLLRELEGHNGALLTIDLSMDGMSLAGGDNDGCVHIWSATGHHPPRIFKGHTARISSVNFSPDGKILASGSLDRCVRLWDTRDGSQLHLLKGHIGEVMSVHFSPNGQLLASGGADHSVRLWSPNSGQPLFVLGGEQDVTRGVRFWPHGHKDQVNTVCFSSDGKLLATGGEDKIVRIWTVENGQTLRLRREFPGHTNGITTVAFSPNCDILASAGKDLTIRLWEVSSGQCLDVLPGHEARINAVRFSKDGEKLASASRDGKVKVWLVKGERLPPQRLEGHLGEVHSIAFMHNENYLVAAGSAGRLQIWDLKNKMTLIYRYSFSSEAWVDIIPDGYFNANELGRNKICYTQQGTTNSYTAEQLAMEFFSPDAIRIALELTCKMT